MTPSDAKRGNVVGVDDLRVLDAEAVVGDGHGLERLLVRVEHDAVAAVADGVRVHLEACLERALRDCFDVLGLRHEQARSCSRRRRTDRAAPRHVSRARRRRTA